jgi:hypothetical protein
MTEDRREAGSWIGQRSDENTEDVRRQLDDDAERVAVTDNRAAGPDDGTDSDTPPKGHREPEAAGGHPEKGGRST